jgi:hypothetical protein
MNEEESFEHKENHIQFGRRLDVIIAIKSSKSTKV